MSARRKARKRALDFLYEADLRAASALELYRARPVEQLSEEAYTLTLLTGVDSHRVKIDELILTYCEDWEMDRMPAIDRNLLRIAIYEILWEGALPEEVSVSEAVELATELSTENSARYINGVLARIIAIKSSLI